MLDATLFGADAGAHHLVNVAFHAANSMLLFLALWRLTRARWRSAFVAALFAVHPVHVESVAWIAERKDVLSAFFWMWSLLAYVAYVEQRSTARYALLLLMFALGLMAKPMVVTLPFVLLLLDFWPLRRQSLGMRRLVIEKLPLLALAAASGVITLIVQGRAGAVRSFEALPFLYRLENAAVSVAIYIVKTIWPTKLAALYPYSATLGPAVVIGAAAFIAVATLLVVWIRTRAPFALTGWGWFLVMLVPVIGLIQVGSQPMADRYMYLPAIGLFIIAAWGAALLLARAPIAAAVVAAAVVVALGITAHAQVETWRDSETLWRHAIDVTGPNFRAHNNLAQTLASTGRTDDAMSEYRVALSINPSSVEAHDGLGLALATKGPMDEAIAEFIDATVLNGRYAPAHLHLATALASEGQFERADAEFATTLALDPDLAGARENRALLQQSWGNALADRGQPAAALDHYDAALRLQPDSADMHDDRGRALVALGRLDDAIGAFSRAASLAPSNADIQFNLGVVLAKAGRRAEAIDAFRRVLALNPGRQDAQEAIRKLGG
jgi:tetratricopeptide (TPR) repeat protein